MKNTDGKTDKLPEIVRIEPSSSCNLRCLHCPTGLSGGGNVF